MYLGKMKDIKDNNLDHTMSRLGFFEKSDLEKNIFDEFIMSPEPHPENSFLQCFDNDEVMPEEINRGFKFNGSWKPAMQFLREDSARCMSTQDPRRTKSSSNLMLDYESTRIEDDTESTAPLTIEE